MQLRHKILHDMNAYITAVAKLEKTKHAHHSGRKLKQYDPNFPLPADFPQFLGPTLAPSPSPQLFHPNFPSPAEIEKLFREWQMMMSMFPSGYPSGLPSGFPDGGP